jgi:hypothetical protein
LSLLLLISAEVVAVALTLAAAEVVVVGAAAVETTTKLSHFRSEGSTRRFSCQEFSDFPYAMERYLVRCRLAIGMIYWRLECVSSVSSLNIY